jgi:hypothetical protein
MLFQTNYSLMFTGEQPLAPLDDEVRHFRRGGGRPIKPLLFCGGRGEGREKQGQKMKKLLYYINKTSETSREKLPKFPKKILFFTKNF